MKDVNIRDLLSNAVCGPHKPDHLWPLCSWLDPHDPRLFLWLVDLTPLGLLFPRLGHISLGSFNPAVSLALTLRPGLLSWKVDDFFFFVCFVSVCFMEKRAFYLTGVCIRFLYFRFD